VTNRDDDELVNMTGHTLHLYHGARRVLTVPSAGMYRLPQDEAPHEQIAGIEVVEVQIDRPGPLPAPLPGVWLVVSQVAALGLAAMGVRRPDILFPGPGVNDRGRTVGCRGLRKLVTR
jgi:hypothetical protein